MATVKDLMDITGKGRQAVTTAIDRGDLPGYRIGPGYIWVPDETLELVRTGQWVPPGRKQEKGDDAPDNPYIKRRKTQTA